jgi:NitT/TauT family transport system substrate-binding protein
MGSLAKLALGAVVAAATLYPAAGRAAEKVTIGITGASSDVSLFLAEKKGFFRDEGLTADLVPFDSGAKMVAPLGAGQLDVGAGAWSAGLFNAIERGIGIKIVADKATNHAPYDYRVVVVRKALLDQGQVKSFADLKGRKVGIVAQGAADNSALNEAMKSVGLKAGDVERVYMGFGAQLVALGNGGIDAAFESEPDATLGVRQGIALKFAPYSAFYPVQDTAVILFGTNFIEGHRDAAQKFVHAYLRAVRFYDDSLKDGHIVGANADYIYDALSELTKQKDKTVFRDMVSFRGNPDGKIDLASLKKDLAFFRESGDVKADFTTEQLVDPSFVDRALKELGPYKPPGK